MQAHCKYAMNDRVRVMNMRDSLHEVTQTQERGEELE